MVLDDYFQIFLRNCKQKKLAATTINFYRMALNPFINYCEDNDKDFMNKNTINDYLEVVYAKYADPTIKGRFISLKVFFNALYDMEYIDYNPMAKIKKPKLAKTLLETFSKRELDIILNYYDRNKDFIEHRNYAILSVLLGTGIRRAELITLTMKNVEIDDGFIVVLGKGNKERFVPIGNVLRRVLKRYIRARNEFLGNTLCRYVFITKDGRGMSESAVNTMFRTMKNSIKGINSRLSPHTFRHTFAKLFLINGGDLFSLQKILGHEDISITRIYVDYDENELVKQQSKFNPLDNTDWAIR